MLRWKTETVTCDYTSKVFAHLLPSWMPCNGEMTAGHGSVTWSLLPNQKWTARLLPYISIYLRELISFLFLFYTHRGSGSQKSTTRRTVWMQKHKTMKNYMKSLLFSECAVIPFLQESYRLKYLSKMACSEANRWSFWNTVDTKRVYQQPCLHRTP